MQKINKLTRLVMTGLFLSSVFVPVANAETISVEDFTNPNTTNEAVWQQREKVYGTTDRNAIAKQITISQERYATIKNQINANSGSNMLYFYSKDKDGNISVYPTIKSAQENGTLISDADITDEQFKNIKKVYTDKDIASKTQSKDTSSSSSTSSSSNSSSNSSNSSSSTTTTNGSTKAKISNMKFDINPATKLDSNGKEIASGDTTTKVRKTIVSQESKDATATFTYDIEGVKNMSVTSVVFEKHYENGKYVEISNPLTDSKRTPNSNTGKETDTYIQKIFTDDDIEDGLVKAGKYYIRAKVTYSNAQGKTKTKTSDSMLFYVENQQTVIGDDTSAEANNAVVNTSDEDLEKLEDTLNNDIYGWWGNACYRITQDGQERKFPLADTEDKCNAINKNESRISVTKDENGKTQLSIISGTEASESGNDISNIIANGVGNTGVSIISENQEFGGTQSDMTLDSNSIADMSNIYQVPNGSTITFTPDGTETGTGVFTTNLENGSTNGITGGSGTADSTFNLYDGVSYIPNSSSSEQTGSTEANIATSSTSVISDDNTNAETIQATNKTYSVISSNDKEVTVEGYASTDQSSTAMKRAAKMNAMAGAVQTTGSNSGTIRGRNIVNEGIKTVNGISTYFTTMVFDKSKIKKQ